MFCDISWFSTEGEVDPGGVAVITVVSFGAAIHKTGRFQFLNQLLYLGAHYPMVP